MPYTKQKNIMYFKIVNNPRSEVPRVLLHIVDFEGVSEKSPNAVLVEIKSYGIMPENEGRTERLTQKIAFEDIAQAAIFIINYSFEDAEKWCKESNLTR